MLCCPVLCCVCCLRDWCGEAITQLGVKSNDYNHVVCLQLLGNSKALCDTCKDGACTGTCPADTGLTTVSKSGSRGCCAAHGPVGVVPVVQSMGQTLCMCQPGEPLPYASMTPCCSSFSFTLLECLSSAEGLSNLDGQAFHHAMLPAHTVRHTILLLPLPLLLPGLWLCDLLLCLGYAEWLHQPISARRQDWVGLLARLLPGPDGSTGWG